MKKLAERIARQWCYPEEHHSLELVLTYHCPNDGKSARVPRVEVRGQDGLFEIYIGHAAVDFLTALNEACQELLR
jgi:hypothetical protein